MPALQSLRYNQHFYQQDGASIHWAKTVKEKLNNGLPNRWIGRSGPINWPPRSPDLSINDFWLWGTLRNEIFKEPRAQNLQDLAVKCETFFQNVDREVVKKCFLNFVRRCEICLEKNGAHVESFM